MTPRLPIVGMMVLLALATPGCFTPSHGIAGYDVSVDALDSPPEKAIVWEETDPQSRPPELEPLFGEADEAHAANRSTGQLVSKERHGAIRDFCKAEWERQTSEPAPANETYPFQKGSRFYQVYFGWIVA